MSDCGQCLWLELEALKLWHHSISQDRSTSRCLHTGCNRSFYKLSGVAGSSKGRNLKCVLRSEMDLPTTLLSCVSASGLADFRTKGTFRTMCSLCQITNFQRLKMTKEQQSEMRKMWSDGNVDTAAGNVGNP